MLNKCFQAWGAHQRPTLACTELLGPSAACREQLILRTFHCMGAAALNSQISSGTPHGEPRGNRPALSLHQSNCSWIKKLFYHLGNVHQETVS